MTPGAAPGRAAKLPVRRLLLVLGVVATLYAAALLVWGDRPQASLLRLWSWTGLQAAALCIANYLLRGLRWRLWMAQMGRHFGLLQGLRLYLAGYAFTPTPGNVGEALRGMMLAREPLGAARSLAIFGAERLADLLCLLLLSLPAVAWLLARAGGTPSMLWAGLAAGWIAAATMAGLAWRFRAALLAKMPWLGDAWACLAIRPLLWFGLTLTAWAAQGWAVWLICEALEMDLSVWLASGFYALAMIAGALSALPAGLGGTEAVLAGLLVASGAVAGQALAITVGARLLTLWLAVGIGVLALLYSAAISRDISFR